MVETKLLLFGSRSVPPAASWEGDAQSDASDRAWQLAQERVLLYLKALGVPARLSLELALEALHRSQQNQQTAGDLEPTRAAMRALRVLLAERRPPCSEVGWIWQSPIPASPMPNRDSMKPAGMDRSLWRALMSWLAKPFRSTPAQHPNAARSANHGEPGVLRQVD